MLSEIVKLVAEIELMTIKKEDVGEALHSYYQVN